MDGLVRARRAHLPDGFSLHSIESALPSTRGAIPNRQIEGPLIPQLLVFQDFHIRGASAPEWNQRYLQMSSGVMRSTLHEWSTGDVHIFGKWMNGRVVQQGGLPRGQLCFALLGKDLTGALRVQGQEFRFGDLLILRGGQEFEFQRPAGVELLSVTFGAESFAEFLEVSLAPEGAMRAMAGVVVRPEAAELRDLRRMVRFQLSEGFARSPGELMQAVREVLARSANVPPQRASSIAAARVVKECQQIASTETREDPLRIEELCSRLRTSRRTLQSSFKLVTGASPVVYLRNLRLNGVRQRLMSTAASELSVSSAATDAGFDHFGHFAGNYKSLFGESPSRTVRIAARDA